MAFLESFYVVHLFAYSAPMQTLVEQSSAITPPSTLGEGTQIAHAILRKLWAAANSPDNNLGVAVVGPSPQKLTKVLEMIHASCYVRILIQRPCAEICGEMSRPDGCESGVFIP